MLRWITLVFIGCLITSGYAQTKLKVEPLSWWYDLQSDSVQLMLHTDNIASYALEIEDVVQVTAIQFVENKNYLFVDLKIPRFTVDTSFEITLTKGDRKLSYLYHLRSQKQQAYSGFSSEDVIYLITPDRYANGSTANDNVKGFRDKCDLKDPYGRHGGDLQGIINKLEEIKDMGFTAIWLNPVLENNNPQGSYHGYAITDFYKVDPRMGTNLLYKEMVDKAHALGIKVIMDQVVNHCSLSHPWSDDLPTKDWYHYGLNYKQTNHSHSVTIDPYVTDGDKQLYKDGWFVETMPDLNQNNPLMARYLIQNSIWWISYLGLDGIRMDTYPYSDEDFMNQWGCTIEKEFPSFSIVGEETSDNPVLTSYWQAGSLINPNTSCIQSMLDFPIQVSINKALLEEENYWSGLVMLHQMLANDILYTKAENMVIFVDNHDMDRFFRQVNQDTALFKMGLSMVYTLRGIPQVFYGTEYAFQNQTERHDGEIRQDMLGGFDHTQNEPSKEEKAAKSFLKELGQWRLQSEAVRKGAFRHYRVENGIYVYFRYTENEKVMVVVNKNNSATELTLERFSDMLEGVEEYKHYNSSLYQDLGDKLELDRTSVSILELK